MMKKAQTFAISVTLAATLAGLVGCCQSPAKSPVCDGVKSYERYSDDLGSKKDVKLFGKDVIVEPAADEKIRINF